MLRLRVLERPSGLLLVGEGLVWRVVKEPAPLHSQPSHDLEVFTLKFVTSCQDMTGD